MRWPARIIVGFHVLSDTDAQVMFALWQSENRNHGGLAFSVAAVALPKSMCGQIGLAI